MIEKLLNEKTIITNAFFNSWQEIIKDLGELLIKENCIDNTFIDSAINMVYKFGPYMIILPEVCFFHGEPGRKVKKTCLSLAVLSEPVYFSEFDNQKIMCAFLFGAVDSSSHLEILKDFTSLLQNKDFIHLITNNGDKNKILAFINKEGGKYEAL